MTAAPTIEKAHEAPATLPNWAELIAKLKLSGLVLHAAEATELSVFNAHQVQLLAHVSHRSLFTPHVVKQLETALSNYQGNPIKLKIDYTNTALSASPKQIKVEQKQAATQLAHAQLASDESFKNIQKAFDASIIAIESQ